jgi:hypothetical protein
VEALTPDSAADLSPLVATGFATRLAGVAGGFGVVAAPGRHGASEGPAGQLVDLPPGLLLEPVVMPALRTKPT